MERFRLRQIDALIATTVIEVGVDVPNATAMVVEQADRFGLAQLHQLRGRVGRGEKLSVCYLIADPKSPEAEARLRVMETISDGFALAEKDFEIRGPGEVLGLKQSGLPPFKVADLVRDRALLDMARRDAAEWIARSPTLSWPEEALIKRRLLKAFGEALGLADVG
jgi:ATP-dependent DNA helicase RecG